MPTSYNIKTHDDEFGIVKLHSPVNVLIRVLQKILLEQSRSDNSCIRIVFIFFYRIVFFLLSCHV